MVGKKVVVFLAVAIAARAEMSSKLDQANEHFYLGEYRAAIQVYNEVLKELSDPVERYRVHYNLGRCHERLGEYDLALKEYEAARPLSRSQIEPDIERIKGLLYYPGVVFK